ncbi:hypothetical protein [Pontibacter akesuensis]|uniref:Uncharacterized protein n=1 Tax=Pontibacter akesuensis TaxID=388950 RepID=A0A1I7KWL5_9BACT|nr:hypothetical protein [Pontibacter akesuensis]GHA80588.1 hypothetical protein GCM10007389_38640 [Pontibacter akesuensis]SFV01825.1 hypothetical protein SAMN04487941_0047 [Pontibacter akesuensis]
MALPKPKLQVVSILQGLYWLVTGIWPFVHLPSFLWVTGPKEDIWLLYTVSVLITVIGGVLLAAGLRKHVTQEIKWLGIASAAGLTGIDVYYATNDVIWDVYLLDAIGEVLLILLWLWSGSKGMWTAHAAKDRG